MTEGNKEDKIRVSFPNGKIICFKNVTITFIETLKEIGSYYFPKINLEMGHLPILSKSVYLKYSDYMKEVCDGWYVNTQSDTRQKFMQILSIRDQLGLDFKVEIGKDFDAQSSKTGFKRVKTDGCISVYVKNHLFSGQPNTVYLMSLKTIGLEKLKERKLALSGFKIVTPTKQYQNQFEISENLWATIPPKGQVIKWLHIISSVMGVNFYTNEGSPVKPVLRLKSKANHFSLYNDYVEEFEEILLKKRFLSFEQINKKCPDYSGEIYLYIKSKHKCIEPQNGILTLRETKIKKEDNKPSQVEAEIPPTKRIFKHKVREKVILTEKEDTHKTSKEKSNIADKTFNKPIVFSNDYDEALDFINRSGVLFYDYLEYRFPQRAQSIYKKMLNSGRCIEVRQGVLKKSFGHISHNQDINVRGVVKTDDIIIPQEERQVASRKEKTTISLEENANDFRILMRLGMIKVGDSIISSELGKGILEYLDSNYVIANFRGISKKLVIGIDHIKKL